MSRHLDEKRFFYMKHIPGSIIRSLGILILSICSMQLTPAIRPNTSGVDFYAIGIAKEFLFDFFQWELSAVIDKYAVYSLDISSYLSGDESNARILEFFSLLEKEQSIQRTSEELYANSDLINIELAIAPLQRSSEDLTLELETSQGLIESLIEKQVSVSLYQELSTPFPLPPVSFRFTELPTMLVISPRDRIETIGTYDLVYGLTIDEQVEIEKQIESTTGMSALIVPLGGLSIYPAMVLESVNAPYAYEVIAHEWTHHHLGFFPLGMNYDISTQLRTMNETTAGIIGKEIAYLTLIDSFPQWAPDPPQNNLASEPPVIVAEDETLRFDFRREMQVTRIRVDQLLADGLVDEAESYMESRRQVFLENGYAIRRINQAYFAFFGSYADTPGYSGEDEVGPAVTSLRANSQSLGDFLREIRSLNSFDELIRSLEQGN